MSGFDQARTYTVTVQDAPTPETPETKSEIEDLLMSFLSEFRLGNEFIYRCVNLS